MLRTVIGAILQKLGSPGMMVVIIAASLAIAPIARSAESSTVPPARTPPSPEALRAQAQRCRDILGRSLISFYLPGCLDRINGGFLETIADGKFVPTGEKFLTLQARQLWFFSTLAREGYQPEETLAAARTGYDFLQTKMADPVQGGYYSKVTDTGAPLDTRKHVYLNSFALYGLTSYYQATKDQAALDSAERLFHVLQTQAHDREHGGYNEFFYSDWRPITDPKEPGYVGAVGVKTYNTHLHLLESFAQLYRAWPDPELRKAVEELLRINTSTVLYPGAESNVDAYRPDWQVVREPRNLRASYGHDVECAWLVFDAARSLGTPVSLLRNWASGLCESSIKNGFDREHGGFFSSGPLREPAEDRTKVWWVQAEALVSMLDMYQVTGNSFYYELFSQTLDFVERHQVASAGGWWAARAADGGPAKDQTRTGPWQGGYHAGRAMMLCAKKLEALARNAPPPAEPSIQ